MNLLVGFLALSATIASLPSYRGNDDHGSHGNGEAWSALSRQQKQSTTLVPSGWGIPDARTSLGRLFRYRITVDRKPPTVPSIQVVEYGSSVLPDWLHVSTSEEDGRLVLCLEGVSGPVEKGKRFYIEVSSHVTKTKDDHVIADHVTSTNSSNGSVSERYNEEIQNSSPREDLNPTFAVEKSESFLPSDSFKDVFAVTVEDDFGYSDVITDGDVTNSCNADEESVETVVTIDDGFYNISAFDRIGLIKRFCRFLGLSPRRVQMLPSGSAVPFSQSEWLVAGPGDSPRPPDEGDGVVFQWNSGCGKVTEGQMEALTLLERSATDGSLRDALGGRHVVGWFVTKRTKQPRPRDRVRYARAVPTSTPVPRRSPPTPKPFQTKSVVPLGSKPVMPTPSVAYRPSPSKKNPGRQRIPGGSRTKNGTYARTFTSSSPMATQSVVIATPSRVVDAVPSISSKDPSTGKWNRTGGKEMEQVLLEPSMSVAFVQASTSKSTISLPVTTTKDIQVTLGFSSKYTAKEVRVSMHETNLKENGTQAVLNGTDEMKLFTDDKLEDSDNFSQIPSEVKLADVSDPTTSISVTIQGVQEPRTDEKSSREDKNIVDSMYFNASNRSISVRNMKEKANSWKLRRISIRPQSEETLDHLVKTSSTGTTTSIVSTIATVTSTQKGVPRFRASYKSTLKLDRTLPWNLRLTSSQKQSKENVDIVTGRRPSTRPTPRQGDVRILWPKGSYKSTATLPRAKAPFTTRKPRRRLGQTKKTRVPRLRDTAEPNYAPVVLHELGKIDVLAGTVFRFRIPNETFHDEDGYTDKLSLMLLVYDSTGWEDDAADIGPASRASRSRFLTNVPPNSWVKLHPTSQVLYGLPSADHIGVHEFWLAAIDQQRRLTNTRFEIRVMRRPESPPLNHEFLAVLQVKYEWIAQDLDARIEIVRKVATVFRDRNTDHVTVTGIRNGSVQFFWANNTALGPTCPVATLSALRDRIISPDGRPSTEFVRAMHPHRVESVRFDPQGSCLGPFNGNDLWYPKVLGAPTSPTGTEEEKEEEEEVRRKPKETEDANFLLYILIPMVVLASTLLLLLILCIVCNGYRKRKKQREVKGIPVIFKDELNGTQSTGGHTSRPVLADEVTTPFQSPPTYTQSLPGSRYSTMKSQFKPYDDDDSSSSRFSSDLDSSPTSPHSIGRPFPDWPATPRGPPPPYIDPYKFRYT